MTASVDLPSVRALLSLDERLLTEELHLVATRRQIAVVRAIADELERCVATDPVVRALQEQLVHELAKLGCRSLEAAAALAEEENTAPPSGVFRRA
jgi:hypothetical protein